MKKYLIIGAIIGSGVIIGYSIYVCNNKYVNKTIINKRQSPYLRIIAYE